MPDYSMPPVCYIAGPYRDPRGEWFVKQNIRETEELAVILWCMGFAVINPCANTAFLGGACPDETWLTGDLAILARCDLIVMSSRWQQSAGARGERAFALEHGIPIIEPSSKALTGLYECVQLKAFIEDWHRKAGDQAKKG